MTKSSIVAAPSRRDLGADPSTVDRGEPEMIRLFSEASESVSSRFAKQFLYSLEASL